MSAFTPQQLTGQKGYRHRTFIGNWSEDVQYEEDQMREYLRRRDGGQLLSQKVSSKVRAHMTPAPLAVRAKDGCVHFGDLCMLQSAETENYLSVDLDDQISGAPEAKYGVTTAPAASSMCRNTWVPVRVPCADDPFWEEKGEGGVLHYGQKFKMQLNPSLTEGARPLRLFSEKLTPTCYSKVTKRQEVTAADYGTLNTCWQVNYANAEYRFEMEGQPVKAHAVVVLQHCGTGQFLCSEKKGYSNDFGTECEVCAHKAFAVRAKHTELPELPANQWAFVNGMEPDEEDEAEPAAEGDPAAEGEEQP